MCYQYIVHYVLSIYCTLCAINICYVMTHRLDFVLNALSITFFNSLVLKSSESIKEKNNTSLYQLGPFTYMGL